MGLYEFKEIMEGNENNQENFGHGGNKKIIK
jgi:hypothetical protein